MSVKKTVKAGTATVTKEVAGVEVQEEEQVGVPLMYDQPVCEVGFHANLTKNMGNYESAKAGVSLMMPCYAGELDEVFEFTKDWVDKKMVAVADELDAAKDQ